jgi:MULE transposase domain/FAR1 DNA-binding domain
VISLFGSEIPMEKSTDTTITTVYTIPEPLELSIGCRFDTWIVAENTIKEYGKRKGFAINRHRVEYSGNQITDSGERVVKKRTYVCEYFGKYKPNKEKPIEQQHNKGSKKTDCKWHVNLSKPKDTDFVHITFIHLDHNHELLANNVIFATTFRRFDISIMKEIEHAVVYGHCDAYTIRNLLQPLFPDQLFLTQDLSNAIQKIKRKHQITGSDASYLLKFLLKKQKEDPTMFVQPLINADSDRLCGIFWMTSNQILLWSRYSDVILHDNTSRTNKYNYPLSLFILVDNNGKSRLGAQAFLNDETQESYEWVLQQTLDATGLKPRVILTDMDPAMISACQNIYKDTYHVHCIWHMSQNIPKRLKHKLKTVDFKTFIKDFWKTRNSLCVEVFE